MKSFTDLEQSKKLAEILPLESADMIYRPIMDIESMSNAGFLDTPECYPFDEYSKVSSIKPLPCWSLAALYSILPNNKKETTTLSRGGWKIEPIEYLDNWWCEYEDENHTKDFTVTADNAIDACVEMIIRLNELKIL